MNLKLLKYFLATFKLRFILYLNGYNIFYTEAYFSLNREVKTQNCRVLSTYNQHEIVQEDLHNKKITFGPYFFEEKQNGNIVSIT